MLASESGTYTINDEFKSLIKRISINKIPKAQKRSHEEVKATEDRVKEDRRFQLEAMIMKIMKEKKVLPHNDLVAELLKKASFPIETAFLNKHIESLIEKDYMKRSKDNASVYEYIA